MAQKQIVLVGTYKDKQLAWIKKNGVYNYPVKDGDELTDEACGKIKELWLYADVKSTRHAFTAEFVRKMSREDFLKDYPSYSKLGQSKHKTYYVFKTKPLDYGPAEDGQFVVARVADFGGRSAKVKKAIEQFKTDGEFAPLAAYLPSDLANVPRQQLRVCEAAVQLNFFSARVVTPRMSPDTVSENPHNVISMFSGAMGLDNGIERAGMNIRLCVEFQHAMAETIRADKMTCMRRCA